MIATKKENNYAHTAYEIRISTMNLYNFIAPPDAYYHVENRYSNDKWQEKCDWLEAYIQIHQPDIIAFQEVFSIDALQTLVQKLNYPHFAFVDTPIQKSPGVYESPVVCLASRYPISKLNPLSANKEVSHALSLTDEMTFSRVPLWASIQLPKLGEVDFYVVHLKSKRPILDEEIKTNILSENLCHDMLGALASHIQRSAESCQLMVHLIENRKKHQRPFVLMGDFNDDLYAESLKPLHLSKLQSVTDDMAIHPIHYYQLYDSWDIYQENVGSPAIIRPYTYFHHHVGSILDYILLSDDFKESEANQVISVVNYHCEDKHLTPIDPRQIHGSDHAVISIDLLIKN